MTIGIIAVVVVAGCAIRLRPDPTPGARRLLRDRLVTVRQLGFRIR